ncbi:MAG: DUF1801 domain-containing protein, partial [Aquirufa sp.]
GKVWHGHPVWFIQENPVVGYLVSKEAVRVLFWSGQSFDAPALQALGKFKAASITFQTWAALPQQDLQTWLEQARAIQWDYKNLIKRKGELVRLS